MRWLFFTLIFTLNSCSQETKRQDHYEIAKQKHIQWQNFSDDIFQKAKREHKFVLLNLHANWCHWCHVMDDSTYSNPKVIEYLEQHYISTSEDHDLRTDLAERYRAYGWPATIVFDAEGNEIVKRAGYIPPENFLRLLKAIVADPSPEEKGTQQSLASIEADPTAIKKLELDKKLRSYTDEKIGGFNSFQRSIHENTFRYALTQSSEPYWKNWTMLTAKNSIGLLDSEWGGIYQYSTQKSWNHAHFEKLLAVQARYMQLYAYYGSEFQDKEVLNRAKKIDQYLQQFMKDKNGLYYNAQDADLKKGKHSGHFFELDSLARLSKGTPTIDSNKYTKENALLGIAYLSLYGATNNESYWSYAKKIYEQLLKRLNDNHLAFRSKEIKIFPIADQIHLAYLSVLFYELTGDEMHLQKAKNMAKSIQVHFKEQHSYVSYYGKSALQPRAIPRENFELLRLFYKLSLYDASYTNLFEELKNWLSQPEIIKQWNDEGGVLLMNQWSQKSLTKIEVFGNIETKNQRQIIAPVLTWPSLNYKVVFAAHESTTQENVFGENPTVLICGTSFCSRPFTDYESVYQYWHQRLTFVEKEN